jgi:hypothetical protein
VLSLCCVCYLGESSQGSHVGTKFFVFIPISLILHFLTCSWSQKGQKMNYMREFCWFSSSLLIISVVPHLKKTLKCIIMPLQRGKKLIFGGKMSHVFHYGLKKSCHVETVKPLSQQR